MAAVCLGSYLYQMETQESREEITRDQMGISKLQGLQFQWLHISAFCFISACQKESGGLGRGLDNQRSTFSLQSGRGEERRLLVLNIAEEEPSI